MRCKSRRKLCIPLEREKSHIRCIPLLSRANNFTGAKRREPPAQSHQHISKYFSLLIPFIRRHLNFDLPYNRVEPPTMGTWVVLDAPVQICVTSPYLSQLSSKITLSRELESPGTRRARRGKARITSTRVCLPVPANSAGSAIDRTEAFQ